VAVRVLAWEDGTRPKDLYAQRISRDPEAHLPVLLTGLRSEEARVRNGSAELISLLSADRPELVYPHHDEIAKNLHAAEPVLRWEAACTLGCLAAADADGKTPAHIGTLIGLLRHKSIVLQGHAARALGKIGRAHPARAKEILVALFSAADQFPGNRVGYLIEAAEMLVEAPDLGPQIRELVSPYAESDIAPVARKAARALKKLGSAKNPRPRKKPAGH
jgi:HEAT repeat protein